MSPIAAAAAVKKSYPAPAPPRGARSAKEDEEEEYIHHMRNGYNDDPDTHEVTKIVSTLIDTDEKEIREEEEEGSPEGGDDAGVGSEKAAKGGYPVTLTVTQQSVYTSTVILGDSFPTSTAGQAAVTTVAADGGGGGGNGNDGSTQLVQSQTNGIPPASIAGIIIGVIGGLTLLFGVFYVYHLRARDLKLKKKKRRKKRRTSSATIGGDGAGPPPPPPGDAPPA